MSSWRRVSAFVSVLLMIAAVALPIRPADAVVATLAGLVLPFLTDFRRGVAIAEPNGTRWVFGSSRLVRVDIWVRLFALFLVLLSVPAILDPLGAIFAGGIWTAQFAIIAALGAVARGVQRIGDTRSVQIERDSITIVDVGARVVPFVDLVEASLVGRALTIVTRGGERHVLDFGALGQRAARRTQRAILAAQDEWRRRRNERTDVELRLARAEGQHPLAWLRELDTLSVTGSGGAAGYREAGVDEESLWETLRRGDALPHARAAAARLLSRGEDARVRVAEQVRVIDDAHARVVVEAALKPTEEAAAELEALEQESLERDAGR